MTTDKAQNEWHLTEGWTPAKFGPALTVHFDASDPKTLQKWSGPMIGPTLHEVMIFNGPLSEAQRARVDDYLAVKWLNKAPPPPRPWWGRLANRIEWRIYGLRWRASQLAERIGWKIDDLRWSVRRWFRRR